MTTMHTITHYATEVRRTLDTRGDPMTYAVWLAEECGEALGRIRRRQRDIERGDFAGAETHTIGATDELGDLSWQVFAMAILIGVDPLDMLQQNVAKLRARYPDGFVEGGGVR